jgi:DNA topoisomerase-1
VADANRAETEPAAEAAASEGLSYVTDGDAGIARRRCGLGFTYLNSRGVTIRDDAVRARIAELAIPPGWQDVWICPRPDGHIQATGRDDDGRKQYIYHPRWREARDRSKYRRLGELGARLPTLRAQVGRALARSATDQERVVAGVVRLLDIAAVRVGNECYAEDNGSFGATTLLRRHLRVSGDHLRFRFPAKSGQESDICLRDRALADLIRDLRKLRAEDLFVFRDAEGGLGHVRPSHVNDYIRAHTTPDASAKDFRTWAASVKALQVLAGARDRREGTSDPSDMVLEAVDAAAALLGNSRATARESYVHPGLLQAFTTGALSDLMASAAVTTRAGHKPGFRRGECLFLALLPHLDKSGAAG